MKVKQAEKALEGRKADMADLMEQNASLSEELEALRKERTVAVRDLAAGDRTKRKVAHDLDTRIEPLALRFEGMQVLIAEAEAQVKKATTGLDEAHDEERAALNAFIAERRSEEQAAIVAALPDRLQKTFDLYIELGMELGRLTLDYWRFERWSPSNVMLDYIQALEFRIGQGLEERTKRGNVYPFRPPQLSLTVPSLAGPIGSAGTCSGFLETIVKEAKKRDIAALTKAFYEQQEEGGETDE
jgi:flagellar motor switch/type III secretory pathway protein FliN